MAENDVQYETRTVHSVRGLEARTLSKMQRDGWELVDQVEAPMLRSRLTFRRAKKPLPRWALVSGGLAVVIVVLVVVVGSLTEGDDAPRPEGVAEAASTAPVPDAAPTPLPSAVPTQAFPTPMIAEPVSDAEVLAAFNDYFEERAASGVVIAATVSDVTYLDGVITVTFNPEAAGLSQETFDYINPFPNLATLAATPIAFNDEIGNRVRPAVDMIRAVHIDGTSLGTLTHAEILALNGLSE